MSINGSSASLPELSSKAKIFYRDESEKYLVHVYQYSTTSRKSNTMKPAAVIYPANVNDIIAVVKHAKERGIGVAVRTGGHQYSGACSTSGDNIQLDLSGTFQSEEDYDFDSSKNLLHIGVSFSLLEMNAHLRKRGLFLPHGQCVHVHLGGHVLTGGYGQLIRAFGLLSDYVEGFDIVLASGNHVTIWRPDSELADKDRTPEQEQFDNDLYWAVLGGSPGNYGILTHVWFRPLHDADYPDSRGMKLMSVYSKEKLEKVLKIIAEINDDLDFPRDFDVCCTVLSDSMEGHSFRSFFNLKPPKYMNLDEKMLHEHPEQYGDGIDYAEKGKMALPGIPLPLIVIYFQWANVQGEKETFGKDQKHWFKRFREATFPNVMGVGFETLCDSFFTPAAKVLKNLIMDKEVMNWLYLSEDEHTPMSELMRYWCWEDIREYVKPYEKRLFWSNKHDLSTNGWPAWLAERVNQIIEDNDKDTCVVMQTQTNGGKNSIFRLNGRPELNHGCHSWRNDTSQGFSLDCFYQPEDADDKKDGRLKRVLQWQAENDTCSQKGGIFCNEDRRFFWGSYQRFGDPDGGANLHEVRDKYFDSEEKYQKLVQIKRRVDPEYIFTANMFGVDANNAPENRQLRIVGRGYDINTSSKPNDSLGNGTKSC